MPLRPRCSAREAARAPSRSVRRPSPRRARRGSRGCDATTSRASTVLARASSGLAEIRRSGRSTAASFRRRCQREARRHVRSYRRERSGLRDRDLALLAELEQREEGDCLFHAREALHLCVEVEAPPPHEQRTEPFDELRDRWEPECHVRERDAWRLDGEPAHRLDESERLLRCEATRGSGRAVPARGGNRARAAPRGALEATQRRASCGGTPQGAAQALPLPPPAPCPQAPPPRPETDIEPSARAALRSGRGTHRRRRGRAHPAPQDARRTQRRFRPCRSLTAGSRP